MTLYCGKLRYEVTKEVQRLLEGLIHWSYVETLERKGDDIEAQKEASLSIKDLMDECEKRKVPNWVGNGALQFGRDNDMRNHYLSEFFEKSNYSEKGYKRINKSKKEIER